MYANLGLLIVSVLWAIVQSIAEAKGQTFSRGWWLVGPVAILAVGIGAVGRAMATTAASLEPMPPDERHNVVAEGLTVVLNAGTHTGLYLFGASAVAALGLGISTLVRAKRANEETRVLGNGVVFASGLGALAFFGLGYTLWETALADYFAAVGLALAGTGYGLVLLAGREEASDIAFEVTNRTAASLLVLTVLAGLLVTLGVHGISMFKGLEGIATVERSTYVAERLANLSYLGVLAGGPLAGAGLMGAVGVIAATDPAESPNWPARIGKMVIFALPIVAALAYTAWQYPDFETRVVEAAAPSSNTQPGEQR